MNLNINTIILGSGRYLPEQVVKNEDFLQHEFLNSNGLKFEADNEVIVKKFQHITGIKERKYAKDDQLASDLGRLAAEKALLNADINKEDLDYIIVAHNFGDVDKDNKRVDLLPTLAARIKGGLQIKNPYCVAYDLPFGCPGWVEGIIQANYFIRSGDAKKILVVGTETISRVCDPHDRDSMIYADGAGAIVLGASESANKEGVLAHLTRSDTLNHSRLLWMGKSYNSNYKRDDLFIKMKGRKLYTYALTTVPALVKACLEKAQLPISKVKKVLIHQANEKMDEAILQRLFKLYDGIEFQKSVMPMIIEKIGNNSVATVPVLYDLIHRGELEGHAFHPGDHIVFASVGAGMNCNAVIYKFP